MANREYSRKLFGYIPLLMEIMMMNADNTQNTDIQVVTKRLVSTDFVGGKYVLNLIIRN